MITSEDGHFRSPQEGWMEGKRLCRAGASSDGFLPTRPPRLPHYSGWMSSWEMNCKVLFKDPGDGCSLSIYIKKKKKKPASSDIWVLKARRRLLACTSEQREGFELLEPC